MKCLCCQNRCQYTIDKQSTNNIQPCLIYTRYQYNLSSHPIKIPPYPPLPPLTPYSPSLSSHPVTPLPHPPHPFTPHPSPSPPAPLTPLLSGQTSGHVVILCEQRQHPSSPLYDRFHGTRKQSLPIPILRGITIARSTTSRRLGRKCSYRGPLFSRLLCSIKVMGC